MILRSMPFEAVEKWRTRRPRRAIESLELEEPIPGSIILFSRRERHHMFAACSRKWRWAFPIRWRRRHV
jgi:hypothetical protein